MNFIRSIRPRHLAALALVLTGAPLTAQQDQSFALTGRAVHVENLVGEMHVERTTGARVEVEVLLRGRDAARLRVERGQADGRETVTVVFPDAHIVYPAMGSSRSRTTVSGGRRGASYSVSGSGPGVEAHAVVRIRLPAGVDASLHQGVGSLRIAGVNGTVAARAGAARVEVERFEGSLNVSTGSGGIRATDLRGTSTLRTGSGGVVLTGGQGDRMELRTGSGGITLRGTNVQELTVSAGSGRLQLDDVRARTLTARTGSGGVRATLASAPAQLSVNTGSGGVSLSVPRGTGAELDIGTGSGGIRVNLPTTTLSSGRSHLRATTGDGSARFRIRTGSGGVTLSAG